MKQPIRTVSDTPILGGMKRHPDLPKFVIRMLIRLAADVT
jgi:hypothetical protein